MVQNKEKWETFYRRTHTCYNKYLIAGFETKFGAAHQWQDSINGVPTLSEHQVFIEHEVEREGLAERVRADPGLLSAVLLKAIEIFIKGLLLRVLLFDQKLDVVTLLALRLDHLHQVIDRIVFLEP